MPHLLRVLSANCLVKCMQSESSVSLNNLIVFLNHSRLFIKIHLSSVSPDPSSSSENSIMMREQVDARKKSDNINMRQVLQSCKGKSVRKSSINTPTDHTHFYNQFSCTVLHWVQTTQYKPEMTGLVCLPCIFYVWPRDNHETILATLRA